MNAGRAREALPEEFMYKASKALQQSENRLDEHEKNTAERYGSLEEKLADVLKLLKSVGVERLNGNGNGNGKKRKVLIPVSVAAGFLAGALFINSLKTSVEATERAVAKLEVKTDKKFEEYD